MSKKKAMNKSVKANIQDQTVKGAVLGAYVYFGGVAGLDNKSLALGMPFILGALAWLSTKVGNRFTTSIIPPRK